MKDATRIATHAATTPPKHHFFGFHDIVSWNHDGDRLLALEVDEIDHPPVPGQTAGVGYVDCTTQEFVKVAETEAWNFPQGARQQWIGQSNAIIFNVRGKHSWVSEVYDTETLTRLDQLAYPTHVVCPHSGNAFGVNYSRLHRLGGYGYVGVADETADDAAPENDGIWRHDIWTKEATLLVSTRSVAGHDRLPGVGLGPHHYLTHLTLNPDNCRLAFLDRCKLPDGGEMTRLMTVGIDGRELRTLACGFLSHYDWMNSEEIIIWGRINTSVERMRMSRLYNMVPGAARRVFKQVAKGLLRYRAANSSFHWLRLRDDELCEPHLFAEGILTQDGHPMFCPANRDWMVCDTYPLKCGERHLMLYQVSHSTRIGLGSFRMAGRTPKLEGRAEGVAHIDRTILKNIGPERYAFTRSGLHCDLHPRWKCDGTEIAFDSFHEGTRQIYTVNVKGFTRCEPRGPHG